MTLRSHGPCRCFPQSPNSDSIAVLVKGMLRGVGGCEGHEHKTEGAPTQCHVRDAGMPAAQADAALIGNGMYWCTERMQVQGRCTFTTSIVGNTWSIWCRRTHCKARCAWLSSSAARPLFPMLRRRCPRCAWANLLRASWPACRCSTIISGYPCKAEPLPTPLGVLQLLDTCSVSFVILAQIVQNGTPESSCVSAIRWLLSIDQA